MSTSLWPEQEEGTGLVPARVFQSVDASEYAEYQHDPVRFLTEKLGMNRRSIVWSENPGYIKHRWDGTPDPLVAGLTALANGEDVGIQAATGTQKTYTMGAGGMLWFLASFKNSIVVTIAPKEDQLTLHLWKEARKLWPGFARLFPAASLGSLKLRLRGGLDESWTATGFVAGVSADEESANKARGFHAEHALYIFEETPGVHDAIQTAIEFTCTAPHNLQLKMGNPDNQQDSLHRWCVRPNVRHIRISALDHPNVVTGDASIVPGAVSRRSVAKMRDEYGEGDPLFNAMVRGIAPKEATNSLIRYAWCEEAAARYSDPAFRVGLPAIGCDVANAPGGDKIAIARGIGACLFDLTSFRVGPHCADASVLGEQLALEIAADGIDERHVGVDAVGVGASTINKLKELGVFAVAINGGARMEPKIDEDVLRDSGKGLVPVELFDNLNSQMHWQMRQDLSHGRIALPDDPELFRDLTARTWERRGGKICILTKEAVSKLLGRSPDKGDAAVYWNWVRHRRDMPEDDAIESAFSPKALARASRESRRVHKPKPLLPRDVSVIDIERLD